MRVNREDKVDGKGLTGQRFSLHLPQLKRILSIYWLDSTGIIEGGSGGFYS